MINKDQLNKTFYIVNKIDNLPVILNDPGKIINNLQFALRIDPFLFIQLLSYSNLEGYGFYKKISMIEHIPLIMDENILTAVIKSNVQFKINNIWFNDIMFFLLIYPVYLAITDLINYPEWLSEEELNLLTFLPAGIILNKYYFNSDYQKIKETSLRKKIPYYQSEKLLKYPKSNLITNIFFVNKHIPLIVPDFENNLNIQHPFGKMSVIIEFLDRFLQTNYYSFPDKNDLIMEFLNNKIDENLKFDDLFNKLNEKIELLFNYLLPEDLKNKIFESINEYYYREKEREKSRKKVSVSGGDDKIAVLEEV